MNIKKVLASISIIALSYSSVGLTAVNARSNDDLNSETSRKIVVFKQGTSDETRDKVLGVRFASRKIKRLENSRADVLENVSDTEIADLKTNPNVLRVETDAIATIQVRDARETAKGGGGVTIQAQTLPWGISKIQANQVWLSGNTADPIKVGIIDTGISLSHPDLALNIKGSYNAINGRKSANDDNGHGSHVAGIIAALNNTTGSVGVAPKADIYAIKVLNAAGSGYISDIIEGIDWAISKNIKVINMSLGCACDVQSMHAAVIRAKNAGIIVVAAAGNSATDPVIYPAAYPEAIAVSATDSSDQLASWSARGPEVDLSAPGVSIYSTYKGTGYATLSGTSMASPHVAGSAALVLFKNPSWTPDQVIAALESTATDLGIGGFDNLFGFGLVNALAASQ
ncbi:hypothetical protein A3H04_00580 [Candidatus Giovannonibacteria bacterium RIFCSPLOWO2_12_FULL_43_11c]|uniref:Peptidase S8/S53 domain-containing protein n=1 Tax=Candidatus Giovannonibacteria bacterium RIFCSPHIGHO2_12_FULL_43_15 TaxID=1798341 RepID=A0A1F5WRR9_9BACT|nr:MAG: hypothetical protein A3B97_00570 [Candidatus Giovannonibacteria bacterium RIFCSPHIGHO2_02_FULL_43_32]OGF78366.1 MAG: hypothetical protein A3F23_02005 [Candidatus Giovannonibacteria bacterium RIFCSPHIGHO2_12_FULL_43_15]OGF92438.1 MAG: hypothetical protein A3H04_00580 [Candidatus Giovannonibacteria bacterium RIFCSPLOWO2_12_FULL_43_11c]